MGIDVKSRGVLIIALVVIGALLASAVTEFVAQEEPLKHHVTTGKVGTNPNDGTVWIAEFIKDKVVFNYTLPFGAVHSKYVYHSSISIVAVPEYSQEFELDRTEEGLYAVYYPKYDATIPTTTMEAYLHHREDTVLLEAYDLFAETVQDVRILSKIHDKPFAINGVVTFIHKDGYTSIQGYVLTVDSKSYVIVIDYKDHFVKSIDEIHFEIK